MQTPPRISWKGGDVAAVASDFDVPERPARISRLIFRFTSTASSSSLMPLILMEFGLDPIVPSIGSNGLREVMV